MSAYYNEHDKFAAEWLRQLIKAGLIADGEVDERDIQNVQSRDLRGFTQCHFFAGVGVWSYALRAAGWGDSRPAWTGSCPCPSFSIAGEAEGFNDPRHLWPYWIRLVRECKPPVIFGEQVDAAIRHGWLDLVQTDLEAEGYAFGKAVLGSRIAGFDDERPRLYFVADSGSTRREGFIEDGSVSRRARPPFAQHGHGAAFGRAALESRVRRLLPRDGTAVSVERCAIKGYGNALNAEVAKGFIESYKQVIAQAGTEPETSKTTDSENAT